MKNDHATGTRPYANTRWWIGGALAAVTVATTAGCKVPDASATASHQETQQHTYQHAIDRITLDLDSGDIRVGAGSAGQVSVQRNLRWDNTKPTVTEKWKGNTLAITVRCASREHDCGTDYQIDLPSNVAIQAKTDAGDITTDGIHSGQDLRSDAGDLSVDGGTGTVSLHTSSGQITGAGLSAGTVDAITDGGAIKLTLAAVPDSVTAKSSAGDIGITVPHAGTGEAGYTVKASTDAGTSKVLVVTSANGRHRIVATSDSGDVQVGYAN